MGRFRPNGRADRHRRRLEKQATELLNQHRPGYRSRARGDDRPCHVCQITRERIIITAGTQPDGTLRIIAFCSARHAHQAGFLWAGL